LALAAAAEFEARRQALELSAVVVDHQLQTGSEQVAAGVARALRGLGIDEVDVVTVTVGDAGGPEASARQARYSALDRTADERDAVVLLGHTLDDQAETVLLGLTRGSGNRAIAGMRPVDDPYRRPFLSVTRSETEQACRAAGLTWWSDPHNADPAYTRVRVRTKVMPVLEAELGPGVAAALARSADLARDDADVLDALAAEATEQVQHAAGGLDVTGLGALAPAIRHRVIRDAARAAGAPSGELFRVHIEAVDRLVVAWHGQRGVDLPGSLTAVRTEGSIRFRPATAPR
jgi:tRNA(Ile)-lysidine synthase